MDAAASAVAASGTIAAYHDVLTAIGLTLLDEFAIACHACQARVLWNGHEVTVGSSTGLARGWSAGPSTFSFNHERRLTESSVVRYEIIIPQAEDVRVEACLVVGLVVEAALVLCYRRDDGVLSWW